MRLTARLKDIKLKLNFITRTIITLEITVSENSKKMEELAQITTTLNSDERVNKQFPKVGDGREAQKDEKKVEITDYCREGCDRERPRFTQGRNCNAPIGGQMNIAQMDGLSADDYYLENDNTVLEITNSNNKAIMKTSNDSNKTTNNLLNDMLVSNSDNYLNQTQKMDGYNKDVLPENRYGGSEYYHIEETWERIILAEIFRNKLEILCGSNESNRAQCDSLKILNDLEFKNENKDSIDGHGQADTISSGELYTKYINSNFGAKLSTR